MRIGYITVSASATGLVAAYNFHARSGTMLTDLSGNANHGRVSGAIWTSQGKVGRALAFDGMNDWVTIANAPSLALGSRGTIAAWVKLTTLGRWQSILAKGSTNNDAAHNYALEITPTNVIRCILGNGTTYLQLDASLTPIPGQFYHLACTWDETTVRLYVNGILNESTAQTLTPVGNTAPLFLGKFGGNIDWLKGTIDEMRIYKRALTTREVRADMRAPVGALPSDAHPPTVSLTAPASGTTVAGSSVAVAATASDNMGIVGVQFLLDGVKIGNEDTTAPYTISWDTTTVPDGFHTVTARARDAAGNRTTSARVRVTVQNLPPPPVATFRATPTSGTAPLSVTFTDQSTGTITSRRWNFGDGHTSMARNPTHIYTTPATYTVRLSVTGPGGTRTSSRTDYIRITPPNTTTEFFEFGDVLADSTWHTVTFRRPFVNPVVVAKPLSNNGRDPAIVRIRNVTPTGFELRIQEWDYLDDVHRQETAGYLVVERGQYTLGGTVPIEAGSLVTNQTNFVTVPWSQSFAVAPVVLTAVASANGGEAVTTRIRNVNRNTFQVRLQEQEKNLQHHALETITYIAWPPSSGVLADSLVFEVHKTPNIMTHRLQTLTFLQDFTAIPVFLADLQTTDGSDPASLRWENKGFFGVDVKVAEEQSAASEIQHTTEVVGYIALAFHNITADSDGDGLTNADEILQYGTDPADVDTDQDGLNDGQEVRFWGTRWNADPDRDGLINLLDLDSDNDGVLDGEEH
jgi:PKD repeat protein